MAQVADIFVEMGLTKAMGPAARAQASHVLGESKYFDSRREGDLPPACPSRNCSASNPARPPHLPVRDITIDDANAPDYGSD